MQRFYKIIKRKRNLRRFAALWLFLLVIELFCPAFGDAESIIAAEFNFSQPHFATLVEAKGKSSESSISACDGHDQNHEKVPCNDECLCHATAIPSVNIVTLKQTAFRDGERPFRYGDPLFNSLPLPFQPPKRS